MMTDQPPPDRALQPRAIRASLAVAAAAWVMVIVAIMVRQPGSMLVAGIGWPAVYGASLGMAWVFALMANSTDQSALFGPDKERQLLFIRGPMVNWINAVIILFPLGVLALSFLGLIGVLPAHNSGQ